MTEMGDHINDANFLSRVTAYGPLGRNPEIMSIKLNYFEASNKVSPENMKTIKLWLYGRCDR